MGWRQSLVGTRGVFRAFYAENLRLFWSAGCAQIAFHWGCCLACPQTVLLHESCSFLPCRFVHYYERFWERLRFWLLFVHKIGPPFHPARYNRRNPAVVDSARLCFYPPGGPMLATLGCSFAFRQRQTLAVRSFASELLDSIRFYKPTLRRKLSRWTLTFLPDFGRNDASTSIPPKSRWLRTYDPSGGFFSSSFFRFHEPQPTTLPLVWECTYSLREGGCKLVNLPLDRLVSVSLFSVSKWPAANREARTQPQVEWARGPPAGGAADGR